MRFKKLLHNFTPLIFNPPINQAYRLLAVVALFMLAGLPAAQATTCSFTGTISSSTNPFSTCPVGTDTIIIQDTLLITGDYTPGFNGVLIVDGGRIIWANNGTFTLGNTAKLILINGAQLKPTSSDGTACNANKIIAFNASPNPVKVTSCSGGGADYSFDDINTAGCITIAGICCNVYIAETDHSGDLNDGTLCAVGASATLSVGGSGTLDYTYTWTPNIGTDVGPYSVTPTATTAYTVVLSAIFDPTGNAPPYRLTCSGTRTITINTPVVPVTSVTDVFCAETPTGAVNLTVTGGTAPYDYLWSTGSTTEDINALSAGAYTVTATDARGCTGTIRSTVNASDNIFPTVFCPANLTVSADPGLCTATVGGLTSIFSDNCSNPTLAYDVSGATSASGTGQLPVNQAFTTGVTLVTYEVTDGAGNTATCTFQVTVADTEAPTASNPPNLTGFQCLAEVPAPDPAVVTDAADNCGQPAVTFLGETGNLAGGCPGDTLRITRTYLVADASGNSITVSQTIKIVDNTAPVATCPADVTVTCSGDVPAIDVLTVTASDNCLGALSTTHAGDLITGQTCSDRYTLTRTYQMADPCGNTAACVQIITVDDQTAPVITTPAENLTLECDGNGNLTELTAWLTIHGGAIAADGCSSVTWSTDFSALTTLCGATGTATVVFTATDACGNSTQTVQTATIIDTGLPVLAGIPADAAVQCSAVPAPATPTASDNCDALVDILFSETTTPGLCAGSYTITRTWTATDDCGNSTQAVQTIEVSDTELPVLAGVPADATAPCSAVPAPATPTATDNCAADVAIAFEETTTPGLCAGSYTITRTWTATDDCGNSTQAVQTIEVSDTELPVLAGVPADAAAQCSAVPAPATPTATDNCTADVVIDFDETTTPGLCAGAYTITRTWTATDNCGNSTQAVQTIEVSDTELPVLAGVPADATAQCSAVPAPATPTATDNCDTEVELVFSEISTPGACGYAYTIIRTWTATDNCGNSTQAVQTIEVSDTELPVLAGVPADATAQCSAVPLPATPTASDNCDASVDIAFDEIVTPGACADAYTITRTWTATDNCGNTTQAVQVIAVSDTEPPVLAGVPANTTGPCDEAPLPASPTATDNCDASVDIVFNTTFTPGACLGSYTLTRTWIATDNCGNSTEATQTIEVVDNEPPVITGVPADADVECNAIPGVALPVATDYCDQNVSLTLDETITPGSCPESYTLLRTWTAIDQCGNSTQAVQTIRVTDTQAPVISCPADLTVTAALDMTLVTGLNLTPAFSDNCGVASVEYVLTGATQGNSSGQGIHDASEAAYAIGATLVTYTVTDACGLTATCSVTVVVNSQYTLTLQADSILLGCEQLGLPLAVNIRAKQFIDLQSLAFSLNWDGAVLVFDTIGNAAPGLNLTAANFLDFAGAQAGTLQFLGTAPVGGWPTIQDDDILFTLFFQLANTNIPTPIQFGTSPGAGNIHGNIVPVTGIDGLVQSAQDLTPPVITFCPADTTLIATENTCEAVLSLPLAVAQDACSGVLTIQSSHPNSFFPAGTTLVTYTATDRLGNSATCALTVTVKDTNPPVMFNCPGIITVSAPDNACSAPVFWLSPVAGDLCIHVPVTLSSNFVSGDVFPLGQTQVEYTATDIFGTTSQCTFMVEVQDTTAPSIQCPANLSVMANSTQCSTVVTYSEPLVSDNCNSSVTISGTAHSGDIFPNGTTVVVYQASDDTGNTTSCAFSVTVTDATSPVFITCPENLVLPSEPGNCGAVAVWAAPIVSDNCNPTPQLSATFQPGQFFPVGTSTVQYTAVDDAGNSAICSFTVEVNAPIVGFANVPATLVIDGCPQAVPFTPPTPTGFCGVPIITSSHQPGYLFPLDTTTVTYTATDLAGNAATVTFLVIIRELTPPVIACPNTTVVVSVGAVVLSDAGQFVTGAETMPGCASVTLEFNLPLATDNCSTPLVTQESGTLSGGAFPVGMSTLEFKAVDAAGNTTQCQVNVEVMPLAPLSLAADPVLACPGELVTITAAAIPGATYTWTNPEGQQFTSGNALIIPSMDNTTAGNYTVAANVHGCSVPVESTSIGLVVAPATADDLDFLVGLNSELELDVLLNDTYTAGDFTVTAVSSLPGLTQIEDGLFRFESGSEMGVASFLYQICSKTCPDLCDIGAVNIRMQDSVCAFIPNVITPNGDGLNDFFEIPCLDFGYYSDNTLVIYNQWGSKVYEAAHYDNDPLKAWEGTLNGEPGKDLPDGTYFYIFVPGPTLASVKGFIQILR